MFRLADRLHKLPSEILDGMTYEEFLLFVAYSKLEDEERENRQ